MANTEVNPKSKRRKPKKKGKPRRGRSRGVPVEAPALQWMPMETPPDGSPVPGAVVGWYGREVSITIVPQGGRYAILLHFHTAEGPLLADSWEAGSMAKAKAKAHGILLKVLDVMGGPGQNPRRNAGKVISLAAFRKKREIEQAEQAEEPAGPRTRRGSLRDLLRPDEPEDEDERSGRGVRAMQARAAWVGKRPTSIEEAEERAAGMKDAMMIKGRLSRLIKVTQGVYSPATVQKDLLIVADYDDATLRRFAFKSTEKQWLEKPSFFRAVMREAADRWGMMAPPKDNPKESVTMKNPSEESHRNNALHYAEEAVAHATEAESLERSGRSHTAYHDHQESRDEAKRALDEIAHAGRGKWPGKAKIESQMRIVIRHAEAGMERTCAPKDNPNTTEHREAAVKLSRAAGQALESALTSEKRGRPWEEQFNSYLNALVWAMAAHREAEYGMPKRKEGRRQRKGARRMSWAVEDTERRTLQIAESAVMGLRQMVEEGEARGRGEGFLAASDHPATTNPANIPGGNMTECIAIMEARGDVESPGALCNWLSRKAGRRRGGRAKPRTGGTAKARAILQRAMRGT